MDEDKKWMLITYYCPTHGDPGRVENLQLTRQEVSNNLYNHPKSKKDVEKLWIFFKTYLSKVYIYKVYGLIKNIFIENLFFHNHPVKII